MLDAFEEALSFLYFAPEEPDRWRAFATKLAPLVQAEVGLFHVVPVIHGMAGPMRTTVVCGPVSVLPMQTGGDVAPDLHAAALHFGGPGETIAQLACVRRRASFGDEARRTLATLGPHVERAVAIADELVRTYRGAAVHDAALDRVAVPLVIVDATLGIHYTNARGDAFLARGGGLRVEGTRLRAPTVESEYAILTVVSRAILERRACAIRLAGTGTRLVVAPLPVARGLFVSRLALLVADGEGGLREEELCALFGLTPREAAVAAAIASGQTPEAIATGAGVALSTVRTHLKVVFQKTGTTRQSELVTLVHCGLPVLPPRAGAPADETEENPDDR